MSRLIRLGVVAVVPVMIVALEVSARAADPIDRLRTLIAQAATEARGHVGVAIKHLESGVEVTVNADQTFPMASTFKLPVLVTLAIPVMSSQTRATDTEVERAIAQIARYAYDYFTFTTPAKAKTGSGGH